MNIFYGGLSSTEKLRFKQMIKAFLENKGTFFKSGITKIEFKSTRSIIKIIMEANKPGYIIGKKGETVKALCDFLHTSGENRIIHLTVTNTTMWDS